MQQQVAQLQAGNLCDSTLVHVAYQLCRYTAASLQLARAK